MTKEQRPCEQNGNRLSTEAELTSNLDPLARPSQFDLSKQMAQNLKNGLQFALY